MADMEPGRFLDFKVDMAHYELVENGGAIVWCFDDRFDRIGNSLLDAFLLARGWTHKDLITEPGGIRVLASNDPKDELERVSLLGRIKAAVELHGARIVVLTVHVDCGGYGYSAAFVNGDAERKLLRLDLAAARDFLRRELPAGVLFESYLCDAKGMQPIE